MESAKDILTRMVRRAIDGSIQIIPADAGERDVLEERPIEAPRSAISTDLPRRRK